MEKVADSLPDGPTLLVLMRGETPRLKDVPYSNPEYMFLAKSNQMRISGIDDFADPEALPEPVLKRLFYMGSRCYAYPLRSGSPTGRNQDTADSTMTLHPACRKMLTQCKLVKLWEEDVPEDAEAASYVAYASVDGGLKFGLYEIADCGW